MPAKLILVEGPSGTGKSTAWENINEKETIVITPNAKDLPFGGGSSKYVIGKNRIQINELKDLPKTLKQINDTALHIKHILIEDFTHFFNARLMDKGFIARKLGNDAFAKWNELAADTLPVITGNAESFRDDLFIVFNAHVELNENGIQALQTPGKLLEKSINIVSYFTYVLHTVPVKTDSGMKYQFLTNFNGTHEAKTPKGMFKELFIPNDIAQVIETIKSYQK